MGSTLMGELRLLGLMAATGLLALGVAVASAGVTGPTPIDPTYIPKNCRPDPGGVALQGGPEDDDMRGTDHRDLLKGDGGDDRIRGFGERDCLFGEGDDDHIRGNSGNDNMDGGEGNDVIVGGKGRDEFHGRPGDDTIYARHTGDDVDRIRCGRGFDTVFADPTDKVGKDCENVKIKSGPTTTT
jgi:Ca2+-binding RTX toxin-like protein